MKAAVAAGMAVVIAILVGVLIGHVFFGEGPEPSTPSASPTPAPTSATPRPTATVTEHQPRPTRTMPRHFSNADEEFLVLIAQDGIRAPDDWAIEAGRTTCGTSYEYAYRYLTDGGLYGHHVQTFLADWLVTHDGC